MLYMCVEKIKEPGDEAKWFEVSAYLMNIFGHVPRMCPKENDPGTGVMQNKTQCHTILFLNTYFLNY